MELKMRRSEFDEIRGFSVAAEKEILIREIDQAFHANDKASCVERIEQLYELLDETLVDRHLAYRPSLC